MRLSRGLAALGVLALCVATSVGAPPEVLTLRDLSNRPDYWPESVTMLIDADFGGALSVKKGESFKLIDFNGGDVLLQVRPNQNIAIAPGECDLLEAANKMWQALTPAQRAVEPATLIEDASLWPEKVAVNVEFSLHTGQVIPAGTEYFISSVDAKRVNIYTAQPIPARLTASIGQTDLVQRARARALIEPDNRPARLVAALESNMIDSDGKPFTKESLAETKLFVFYFGASWCGPCRQFSPEFVKYIDSVKDANPNLTVVMLNADEEEDKMLAYMQAEKMPFPAVKFSVLKEQGALYGFGCGSIPQIVVTDRHGKILANTYENERYLGPKNTFAKMKKLIDSGAAK